MSEVSDYSYETRLNVLYKPLEIARRQASRGRLQLQVV